MPFGPSHVAHASLDQMFRALEIILDKAEEHARSVNVEDGVFLNWRLAPDMFTMARQVQIACDIAVRGVTRLAGAEIPSFPDNETNFAELRERVAKARKHISSLDSAAIDKNPDADITVPMRDTQMTMRRDQFLLGFVLPNVHFHVTAAYLNLRNAGVPLGKADFLARA
jgi:hypothetical protein